MRNILCLLMTLTYAVDTWAGEKEFEACRKKMVKAQKLEVLYDIQLKSEAKIYVGPTFFTIPIDAKQGFADTANCLLSGGETGKKAVCVPMTFYHWQTGKAVAEYSMCKLTML